MWPLKLEHNDIKKIALRVASKLGIQWYKKSHQDKAGTNGNIKQGMRES